MQTVKEFIEKVKANGNKDVTLYMYPGEGHGFMNGGQDIHKMMKSKFTPTVSDVYLTLVTSQQQNLINAECTLGHSTKSCEEFCRSVHGYSHLLQHKYKCAKA